MSSMPNVTTFSVGPEDPLSLLPRTTIQQYKKNDVIYAAEDRGESLYLIIDGRVKVSRLAEGGREVILGFYHKDEFFGESRFLGADRPGEQATAVDPTSVMVWTTAELRRLMQRTPALGPALLRVVAQKLSEAHSRIEGFCLDPIPRRLARGLLNYAERLGQPAPDQWLHLPPITHEQLARYIGTSREIITQYMNRFRREHLLKYSRRGVEVDPAAMNKYLEK